MAQRPIKWAAGLTFLVSLSFIANPALDRSVSALFYDAGAGFPANDDTALRTLRFLGRLATWVLIAGLLVTLAGKLRGWEPLRHVTWPTWWFLTSSLALGPGLVVNGILKEFWGRARPVQTEAFGGAFPFTAPWLPASSCESNCSFVSGEASAAIFLVAFAFVVSPAWRAPVAAAALCWAFLISLNRIAFGAHFLSDVLIGWGLTLIVILAMREIFLLPRPTASHDWAEALPVAEQQEA
jgi:lipid A 4'-phosphatase